MTDDDDEFCIRLADEYRSKEFGGQVLAVRELADLLQRVRAAARAEALEEAASLPDRSRLSLYRQDIRALKESKP